MIFVHVLHLTLINSYHRHDQNFNNNMVHSYPRSPVPVLGVGPSCGRQHSRHQPFLLLGHHHDGDGGGDGDGNNHDRDDGRRPK